MSGSSAGMQGPKTRSLAQLVGLDFGINRVSANRRNGATMLLDKIREALEHNRSVCSECFKPMGIYQHVCECGNTTKYTRPDCLPESKPMPAWAGYDGDFK